ncbi:MAG: ABC transporter substrate-binding protein, partial [Kiritimatiellae bacterium]|nr:ABC transporter substrate-binding protein [Kiritimatiellia bacterium]
MRNRLVLIGMLWGGLWGLSAGAADSSFPAPGWKDEPNPLASPHAYRGGNMNIYAGQYPKSFNYYLDNNVFSGDLFGYLYENLINLNPLTMEYEPGLASSWTISEDKLTYTFTLDKAAVWSDGQPVTADDVAFTYETLLNPANLTGPHKVALEKFNPPEVLDERTIRFTATEVHWRNLSAVGGMQILPKHAMAGQDFNRINFEFPVVSGPYRIDEIQEGILVRLARREDWWAGKRASAEGVLNFDTLTFRFFAEQENAFEAFRKGLLDVFPGYMSRIWMNETSGERFAKNWIVKQKVYNANPIGFQGFAMNLRRPPFDDLRV